MKKTITLLFIMSILISNAFSQEKAIPAPVTRTRMEAKEELERRQSEFRKIDMREAKLGRDNPLLIEWDTPFQTPPFDLIQIDHYIPAFKYALRVSEQEVNDIAEAKFAPTFENTIVALEKSGALLTRIRNIFFNMLSCSTSPELQKLAQEISPVLTEHANKIYHNKALFAKVNEVYTLRDKLTNEEDRMLLDKTYRAFIDSGAGLSEEQKEKFRDISVKLSKLTLDFGQNALAATNEFYKIFSKDDLTGVPESVLAIAQSKAKSKEEDGYLFDLTSPSYTALMKYADNRDIRKEFYLKFSSRAFNGENDNTPVIKEIVSLRNQLSQLLGFKNYAEYALQDRMAENCDNVYNLLDQLSNVALPIARKEIKELTEFAHKSGLNDDLQRWDFSYYSEKQKNEKFNINDEMLKPYFKLENVIDGVFKLTENLFNLTYISNTKIAPYHPDVKVYEVYRGKQYMGILYLDFHPRDSKRSGAWMTSFREQYKNEKNEDIRPLVSLVMNFTPSTDENPSLLTYNEVNTFLHEFGHAMHGLLSEVTYESLSGTSVPRDFVELPSQLMENWGTEKDFLKTFAYHYKTKELIPQDLIKKMKDVKNYLAGYSFCRQLTFGYLDMMWHTIDNIEKIDNILGEELKAIEKLELFPSVENTCISTAFNHIFAGGYAAGYYSYKWAEVLEADAFSLFQEKGTFNKKVADSFVTNILSRGGSKKATELYVNFRGREPKVDALLIKSGLTK